MPSAVFLDRDGTINRDVPYCGRPEQLELLPGAAKAIATLNRLGFIVVVVTNQSGVARGYFEEAMLAEIHGELIRQLAGQSSRLDAIYYCPHHPDDGCNCRKPGTALALRAARELGIDLASSWVVGDAASDVKMGRRLGCRTVRLTGSAEPADSSLADFLATDLAAAARRIEAVVRTTAFTIAGPRALAAAVFGGPGD